ncbi:hypothetical protein M9H77_26627 [Catharanthus roseus]|uniref:Uncharacterized protein n=1 Tax=Catharanthus roseus TaxID=4058 RepID=A0ACC0AAK4_CATRO|nr:hypothetical protein M9H77_26627 [Catharanthus roseus]
MKTLLNLKPPSLYTTRPPPPLWNQIAPILHSHTRKSLKYPDPHLQSWRLHAEAKGFNRPPPPPPAATSGQQKRNLEGKSPKINNNAEDDDDKIPDAVWERIMGRILFYVGVPMATGVALMQIFSVIKEYNLWEVPIWLPYLSTFITFGVSTLGIVYGTLSTSWDPEKEGSLLGFEEAQKNWVAMWNEEDD